jgi:hypothetical protein
LRQACFSNNQYEHNAFKKCFSNLLGVGFRRFTVDTYWDAPHSTWSLCPVELPGSGNNNGGNTVSTRTGPTVAASTDTVSAKIPETTVAPLNSLGFARRQDLSQSATPTVGASAATSLIPTSSSSTSSSARPTVISFPSPNGPPLLQIGDYNCTVLMRLDLLTGVLEDFLDVTSTTTGAALLLLTLDVHAAASISNPNAPAPDLSQPQLPESGTLLSDVMKGNLSSITYTPSLLDDQRSNLNTSWYDVEDPNRPVEGYYNVSYNAQRNRYTLDGWPTEAFAEFQKFYRLGISYGTIDSQMQLYNIGTDLDFIFPPGTFANVQTPTLGSSGQLSAGCLFVASDTGVVPQRNSSWAISTLPTLDVSANPDLMAPLPVVTNLTSCGITPVLNQTLGGATADKNALPYAAYVHSTLWSWAPGEPLNATNNKFANRCVEMTTSPNPGRWRTTDCTNRRRVACHLHGQPYNWQISNETSDYNGATNACRSPYEFSIPHTRKCASPQRSATQP